MRLVLLTVFLITGSPLFAQGGSLGEIRTELEVLKRAMAGLQSELASGGGTAPVISGDTLQRIDAIQAGLARLTAKAEELENRINRIVADGTTRIGDLEFRLLELEGGDFASLEPTQPLGGDSGVAPPASPVPVAPEGPELAVTERADFERAEEALIQGDFRSAAEQFASFTKTYPGSPLEADAHFLRGEALSQAGDTQSAARAYLESFSGFPTGARAPSALYKLGLALDGLGQRTEACLMLEEVGKRYPGSDQVGLANQSRTELNCG